jgi:ribose 5-phosphate isomerase B
MMTMTVENGANPRSHGGKAKALEDALELSDRKALRMAMASDHAGFRFKEILTAWLRAEGFTVRDFGVFRDDIPADYPDQAALVADALRAGEADRGIIICGSGMGVSVAANKFPGIRAGLCHDCYSARQGVEHDDINVLCLGSRVIGLEIMRSVIAAFMEARFSGGSRHRRRLGKLLMIERKYMR